PELLASALFASCAGGPRPLHSSPTRRSSDLTCRAAALGAPTRRAAALLVGGAPVRCRRSGPAPPSPRRALLAGLVEELLQLLGVDGDRRAAPAHGVELEEPRQAVADGLARGADHLGQVLLREVQVDDGAALRRHPEVARQAQEQVREAAGGVEGADLGLPLLRLPQARAPDLDELHGDLRVL